MKGLEEVGERGAREYQPHEVRHVLNYFVAQRILEMIEVQTGWDWYSLRAYLLDRRMHILREEGFIYLHDNALERCRRDLNPTENCTLKNSDRDLVLGGVLAAQRLERSGMCHMPACPCRPNDARGIQGWPRKLVPNYNAYFAGVVSWLGHTSGRCWFLDTKRARKS